MTDLDVPGAAEPTIRQLSSSDLIRPGRLNRFCKSAAMGAPNGTEGFRLDLRVIQLGPVTIGRLSFGAPVTLTAPELRPYHVAVPMTGRIPTWQGRHKVTAEPGSAAVFRPGPALETELSALLGRAVHGPVDLPSSMSLSEGPGRGAAGADWSGSCTTRWITR
jgi:hypothetical protein